MASAIVGGSAPGGGTPPGGGNDVPEPATIVMMLARPGCLVAIGRRLAPMHRPASSVSPRPPRGGPLGGRRAQGDDWAPRTKLLQLLAGIHDYLLD